MHWGWSFRRFWMATGVSSVADGLSGLALTLAALQVTRSPLLISVLRTATGLPWLFFGLVAGAISDRVDRRRLMVSVQVVRGIVLAGLTGILLAGPAPLWLLYVVGLVIGVAETLFDTSSQTVLPKVVPAEQLMPANTRLTGAELVGNFFIGPPLAGLIAAASTAAAFATGSAMYLLAGLAVLSVRGNLRARRDGARTSIRADVAEGVRYLRGHALLRRLGLLTGARLVTFSAVSGVLPVYAVAPGPMGLSARGLGFFSASTAIGAVLSTITGERLVARVGAARCLHLTMVAFAVTELSPLAVNPVAVGALWMVGTYFVIIWNVVTLSVRQRVVPERLLGRVNSAFRVLSWGAAPVGALLGGGLAELTDVRFTFVVCAVATALLALWTRPLTDESLVAGEFLPRREAPV